MNQETILLALAILPVLVLATFIYRKDKFEKEPFGMLLKAFFFGCLSVLPAIFIESLLTNIYTIFGGQYLPGVVNGLYNGYIVAGCSEEFCKLMLLTWAVWKSKEFNEYFDGIVYATFVSLGFAGIENIMYVFSQDGFDAALMTGGVRAFLSVPAHFLFGVVMGYYFAMAKFQPERRATYRFKAFLYPMLLHGTFDALLMIPEATGMSDSVFSMILFAVFIYFDIKMWKVSMRRLNHLQELSGQQQDENRYAGDSDTYGDSDWQQPPQQGDPFKGFNWDN